MESYKCLSSKSNASAAAVAPFTGLQESGSLLIIAGANGIENKRKGMTMKTKIITLFIAVVAMIVPFFFILEHSSIKAGAYLAFAIMALGGISGLLFRKELKNEIP